MSKQTKQTKLYEHVITQRNHDLFKYDMNLRLFIYFTSIYFSQMKVEYQICVMRIM